MPQSNPDVSAIMATFNGREVIADAVESVRSQKGVTWELIIVDDASTDDVADVVESFGDSRIRLIRNAVNMGSGESRNIAAANSRGRYLAVVDDDDISHPERFLRSVEVLDREPDIAIVAAGMTEFGRWGEDLRLKHCPSPQVIAERLRNCKTPVGHPSVMVRREEFFGVGGYDARCRRAQDYTLLAKFRAEQFKVLPLPLVKYRIEYPLSFAFVRRNFRYHDLAVRIVKGEQSASVRPLTARGFAKAVRSYFLVNGYHYIGLVTQRIRPNG